MRFPFVTMQLLGAAQANLRAASDGSAALPQPFSSGFQQPLPPIVKTEFTANFNQHKWNANVSHISSGFIYNSAIQNKVRVDATADHEIVSSLFDYGNLNDEGVSNRVWTLAPTVTSTPQVWDGFVVPAFPLVLENLLVAGNAIYQGLEHDEFSGDVVAWDLLFNQQIPATVYIDGHGAIQGYDFWGVDQRTRVVTRFFNIVFGAIDKNVFDSPK